MRLIKPSFEIIPQGSGEIGMFKHIETCGRVAWKSEERITDNSYVKFLEMLKGVNHGSVLEHGTVYLTVKWYSLLTILFFFINKYSKVKNWRYITTNYRVIVDHKKYNVFLKHKVDSPTKHEKRFTVRFICDRGVSHEYVRHRVFSFTQESTRFCNYMKEKFGGMITFILPIWSKLTEGEYISSRNLICKIDGENKVYQVNIPKDDIILAHSLLSSERYYFRLLEQDWKPQQARTVLPNALKTELIMTGFTSDWKHFFKLRCAKAAHPQARELALPLLFDFKSTMSDFIDIDIVGIIQ